MKIYPEWFHPDKYSLRDWNLRERFTRNYSWAIPSLKAIRAIVKFSEGNQILEIGAGKGYWASLLHKAGGHIRCIDLESSVWNYVDMPHKDSSVSELNPFFPVEFKKSQEESLIESESTDIQMFCWPEYGEKYSFDHLKTGKPSKVIYIGEDESGCCGCKEFFEELSKNYNLVEIIQIPQWSGIHDRLYLFLRK